MLSIFELLDTLEFSAKCAGLILRVGEKFGFEKTWQKVIAGVVAIAAVLFAVVGLTVFALSVWLGK